MGMPPLCHLRFEVGLRIFCPEELVKCSRCPYRGTQSKFPQKKNLSYKKTCVACTEKTAEARVKKRSENDAPPVTGKKKGPAVQPAQGYTTLEWDECVSLITEYKNQAFELETFVSMTGGSAKARSRPWEVGRMSPMRLRVRSGKPRRYKSSKKSTASSSVKTYTYYCAQNRDEMQKPRQHEDPRKRRARMTMTRFECDGMLHITIDDDAQKAPLRLRLQHHEPHLHYVEITINQKIKTLVESLKHESATNIWTHVLRENPETEITQKQIYALWSDLNEGAWRLDDDQVKSAQMVLQKMEGTEVELIPINPEPGIHSITFGFKEILDGWAEKTEELAMDSTWKTNQAGYELYGFVGEAIGQAMPFAFMFTTSTSDAAEGAKTRMLRDILKYMAQRCPNIMFTLSDKEVAEINACRAEIPRTKHQLCYWHGIRYIEERLAENKPPAHYDPRKAHKVFDFIDPTWAPGVS
ncbi:hypothetical protein C8J57DRAFT_1561968, partial [Mycena rebaudengoi]